MAERMWHPISKLDFLVDHTASWLRDVRENAVTLRRTIYLFRPRVPGPAGPPAANRTRGQRPRVEIGLYDSDAEEESEETSY